MIKIRELIIINYQLRAEKDRLIAEYEAKFVYLETRLISLEGRVGWTERALQWIAKIFRFKFFIEPSKNEFALKSDVVEIEMRQRQTETRLCWVMNKIKHFWRSPEPSPETPQQPKSQIAKVIGDSRQKEFADADWKPKVGLGWP